MSARTITLSDRPPVRIDTDEWPVIAESHDFDGEHASQAIYRWTLKVRRHADGRCLLYGVSTSAWPSEPDRRGGVLLGEGADLIAAADQVAKRLGLPAHLYDELIADLPAEVI